MIESQEARCVITVIQDHPLDLIDLEIEITSQQPYLEKLKPGDMFIITAIKVGSNEQNKDLYQLTLKPKVC